MVMNLENRTDEQILTMCEAKSRFRIGIDPKTFTEIRRRLGERKYEGETLDWLVEQETAFEARINGIHKVIYYNADEDFKSGVGYYHYVHDLGWYGPYPTARAAIREAMIADGSWHRAKDEGTIVTHIIRSDSIKDQIKELEKQGQDGDCHER